MPDNPFEGKTLDEILKQIPTTKPPASLNGASEMEDDTLFKRNEAHRQEGAKAAMHGVFLYFIKFAFWSFVLVFGIRALHLILPLHCHWLGAEQIQGIDKLIFSGAIGGFIGRHISKITN